MKNPPLQQQSFFRRPTVWVVLFLTVSTAIVYVPVLRQDFVHYDDPGYAFNNPDIRNGLNGESIRWSFTTFAQANWHPLTWLSLIVDYRIFDGKAWGFKLVNLLLHIANTLLLFWLLNRMTGGFWNSAFVAALFALHPLHVESVAWVAERKDLLSSLFWFLTMIGYVRYAERPGWRRYWPIPVLFALGLMAKPILVTLPFVLLLTDIWPMRRLNRSENRKTKKNPPVPDTRFPPQSLSLLVMEKIPLFLLVVASCIITFIAQRHGGAVATLETFDFNVRIQNAIVAYMSYLGKMVWPAHLAPFYLHPGASISKPAVLFSSLALIGITAVVLWQRRNRPYLPVGWFWYLGTLVPVIGLVQVGAQSMADRYTYIPLIGIFMMITWWIGKPVGRPRPIPAGIAVVILAILGVVTFHQTSFWKDTLTLGNRVVQVSPNAYVGQTLLGIGYNKEGEHEKAIAHLSQSLRMMPGKSTCHNYLANSFSKLGQYPLALFHVNKAIQLGETSKLVYYEKGTILAKLGRHEQACQAFREALKQDPENPAFLHELGLSLGQNHQLDEAIKYFQQAIACNKHNDPVMVNNLGHAWLLKREYDKAIPYFQKSLEIDPDFMLGHLNLNKALILSNAPDEAIRHSEHYIQSHPNNANALYVLGAAQAQLGRLNEAINTFRTVLRIDPCHADAKRELSLLLRKTNPQP